MPVEQIALADLKPHPRNYVVHPDDQLEHLAASIRAHGVYRNVVCARDGTLLAGHGVVEACRRLGLDRIPVVRLPLASDDPRALAVLAGDNEIAHLRERDDRALTELLRELREADALAGTGYDDAMLAALALTTRTEAELPDVDAAAAWLGAGLPAQQNDEAYGSVARLVVSFDSPAERDAFAREFLPGAAPSHESHETLSIWWPPRPNRHRQRTA